MPGPMALFRELHHLKVHARDLNNEIDRGPKNLRVHQEKVDKAERAKQEATESLKKLRVETSEKEGTLKTKHGLIEKYSRQLNEASSPKEYNALKHEITAEREACAKLEDEILEAMTEAEVRAARFPDFDKEIESVKSVTNRLKDDIMSRRNELTDQLNEVRKQIEALEAQLVGDAREKYNKLSQAQAEDAMAALNGKTCTACYNEIISEKYNDLLQERFVVCSCDRILYIPSTPA